VRHSLVALDGGGLCDGLTIMFKKSPLTIDSSSKAAVEAEFQRMLAQHRSALLTACGRIRCDWPGRITHGARLVHGLTGGSCTTDAPKSERCLFLCDRSVGR